MPLRVALNMIVKNESAIIERCLTSVLPAVDRYVICDTGSTDDTIERMRGFFDAHGVPGAIHSTTFPDFASARNEALERCRADAGEFDYILLTDADMELRVDDREFRRSLAAPAYSLRQQNTISYYNTRLIRRDLPAAYVGMTHEYLSVGAPPSKLDTLWFLDHACGSSRAEKFERDLRLLNLELERDPHNTRAMFYLAQTYRDRGDLDDAIAWYERRAAAGGWEEEAWYARYSAALCRMRRGEKESFERAARHAFATRPWRTEPLAVLAQHYLDERRQDDALTVAELAAPIPRPANDLLFVHDEVYAGRFDEIVSIGGFYSSQPSRVARGRETCERLATARTVAPSVRDNARRNYVFYARSAAEVFGACQIRTLRFDTEPPWRAMNPSVWLDDDGTLRAIVRTVNYRIHERRYVFDGEDSRVRTRNFLVSLSDTFEASDTRELTPAGGPPPVAHALVLGAEDCRLFRWRNQLCCTFTVRDRHDAQRAEMAFAEIEDDGTLHVRMLRGYRDDVDQKNWMPLVRGEELFFVYATDPLVILRYDGERLTEFARHDPPLALDHLRGGPPVARIDGGWLYLTHEIAFHSGGRAYLHRFVVLDEEFRVVTVSEPFFFEARRIEFAAGFAIHGNRALVSFGVNDTEARIATFDLNAIRMSGGRLVR